MSKIKLHGSVIKEVEQSPEGKHIGVLFDLDKTLLAIFSAGSFMQARMRSGQMTRAEVFANFTAMSNYLKGKREFADMVATSVNALKGEPEADFLALGEGLFKKSLASSIYPEARALVKAHQKKGHTLAIVSAATPYQIQHVAKELGIEHILCTRYEVNSDGNFTGEVVQPACWGEGKAHYGRQFAEEQGLDLEQSYFYTDAVDDLPLLEIVGRPRPLNPDAELAEVAKQHGWPIQHFNPSAKPDLRQKLRSALMLPALLPSILIGLPIRTLTGSTKRATESAMRTWAELSCAAIGIEVNTHGREHLWSQRPCLFIYNHQSGADALVVARVLERDYVGIAKKEIADIPIFGTAAKLMGTVFVDRSATSAEAKRSALKPVFEALEQGMSIVMAPEGTRSNSYKMGPFKKGAFHIAMQAGIPIVPFVIHNAIDILPKGAKVYRPGTVEVEVLPPISTAGWRVEDLDQHVARVRGMFLESLGQTEELAANNPQKAAADSKQPAPAKPRKTRTNASKSRPATSKAAAPVKAAAAVKKATPEKKTAAVKKAAAVKKTAPRPKAAVENKPAP